MKSPSWGTPSGDTENSLWVAGGLGGGGEQAGGPQGEGSVCLPGAERAPGAPLPADGRDGLLRCESGGGSAAGIGGPGTKRRGRRGPEGRRARQGSEGHGSAGAHSAGWHPGGRPGGGSPSPARRRRSCSSPWRGRRSPEAAPGAQLRPGAPRHASRRAPGEGAAWPRTTRQRRRRRRQRQELRRLRGPGQAPATSPGGGSGGGGGCAAPAPLLLLQLLPSGKGRAAAAAPPPGPRLPPPAPSPAPAPSPGLQPPPPRRRARLPSDSPPPVQRRAARTAGTTAAQNEAGPLGARRSLRGAGPISRWHRGRALPRGGERASEAEAPVDPAGSQREGGRLASVRARHGEVTGGRSFSRVGAPLRSMTRSFF